MNRLFNSAGFSICLLHYTNTLHNLAGFNVNVSFHLPGRVSESEIYLLSKRFLVHWESSCNGNALLDSLEQRDTLKQVDYSSHQGFIRVMAQGV